MSSSGLKQPLSLHLIAEQVFESPLEQFVLLPSLRDLSHHRLLAGLEACLFLLMLLNTLNRLDLMLEELLSCGCLPLCKVLLIFVNRERLA